MVAMRQEIASENAWSDGGTGRAQLRAPLSLSGREEDYAFEGGSRFAGSPLLLSALAHTIRTDVLPRLVLAHRAMNATTAPSSEAPAMAVRARGSEVAELTSLAIGHDAALASAFVQRVTADGTSVEAVYLELLAPAARRLGEMWCEDLCDIADVTLGMWRLREVMRDLSPVFQSEVALQDHGRSILLLPSPGEAHSFGLQMVSEFFRRAGWNVSGGPHTSGHEISEWVGSQYFAIVGFSAICDTGLEALASAIRTVRRRSRNRAVGVMVGGPVFTAHPEFAAQVGADATASDGRQAVRQAHGLVGLLTAGS